MRRHHHGRCHDRNGATGSREERLRFMEGYRRDLEQELADVSTRISELEAVADARPDT